MWGLTVRSVNGSTLFGVSIRSWNASVVILLGMITICWDALQSGDVQWVNAALLTAMGFLFGKAAGKAETTKPPEP